MSIITTGKLPQVPISTKDGANPFPFVLVFDNRLIARAGASVSADSEAVEGDLAAGNLLTEYSDDPGRSDTIAGPEIAVTYPLTLGGVTSIDWVSHHFSNILVPWRADLYHGDPAGGGELLATSDWVNPVVKSEWEDFDFDDFPWILGPSDQRLARMAAERRLSSFYAFAETVFNVDHVLRRFDVQGGGNGNDDFIQAALMFGGRMFQPSINMVNGTEIAPIDLSISRRNAAGADTGVDREIQSELALDLEQLTASEAQTVLFTDWVRTQPKSARIFVYQEPAPEDRLRFYDGGAFVGVREAFSGVSVDEEPGQMGDIFGAKATKGIKIRQTG